MKFLPAFVLAAGVLFAQRPTLPSTQYPTLDTFVAGLSFVTVSASAPSGSCTQGKDLWYQTGVGFSYCSATNTWTPLVPTLAAVATTGAYSDLTGRPTIPSVATTSAPLKGNGAGSAIAAVAGTDYAPPTSGTSLLKGNGSGGTASASAGDIPNIGESQVTGLASDLAARAPLASPTFTGTPAAPTASTGDNSTQIATTAFVKAALPVVPVAINPGCDGTTDVLTAIQTAITNNPDVLITAQSGVCIISAPLSFPSNRHLTVSPTTTIKLKANSLVAAGVEWATNSDYTNGNSNIVIEGGIWDGNAGNETRTDSPYIGGVGFRFRKVTGLTLRNMTQQNSVSFHNLIIQSSNVTIDGIVLNDTTTLINQDAVHIVGPSSKVIVRNIIGQQPIGDDIVGISANDVAWLSPVYGNVSDVAISNIVASSGYNLVRIVAATNSVYNVQVSNVNNTGTGQLTTMDAYGLGSGGTIQNVAFTNAQSGGHVYLGQTGGANIYNLTLKNITGGNVQVAASTTIDHLMIDGYYTYGQSPMVTNAGSINSLSLRGVRSQTGAVSLLSTTGSGTIKYADIADADIASCTGLISTASGSGVTYAKVVNSSCDATGQSSVNAFSISGYISTLELVNTNVVAAVDGIHLANSLGQTIRIITHGYTTSSLTGSAFNAGTGNTVSVRSADFAVTRSALTPLTNDFVIDSTNGPSWWNGSAWVNSSGGGGGSTISSGTYASLPACSTSSFLYLFTNSLVNSAACNGSSTLTYLYGGMGITPAAAMTFTSSLQSGVTTSSTTGVEVMSFGSAGSSTASLRFWSAPSQPYTQSVFTVWPAILDNANYRLFMVGFADASTHQAVLTCGVGTAGATAQWCDVRALTSGAYSGGIQSAVSGTLLDSVFAGGPVTIVLGNDGTNISFGISHDGGISNTPIYSGACATNTGFANCAAITRHVYGGRNDATGARSFDLIGVR